MAWKREGALKNSRWRVGREEAVAVIRGGVFTTATFGLLEMYKSVL